MRTAIEDVDVDRFRSLVERRFGLSLEQGDRDRLLEALDRGIRRSGCSDPAEYVWRLEDGACSRSELASLVEDLTIAETYFFRHPDQFQATLEQAIHKRLRNDECPRRLRMLSAGCASGEEAYSLAILGRENLPGDCQMSVLGIDINANLLTKAVRGHYTAWSLRGVSDDIRRRHFQKNAGDFVLNDSVRDLVNFSEHNLVGDDDGFWQPDLFDVIFCRNVLMYLTPESVRTVIGRLTRSLVPGGLLFLGPVETLRGMSHDFHLQHSCDTFYYQRRLNGEGTQPLPATSDAPPLPFAKPSFLSAPIADQSWVTTIGLASERVAWLSSLALTDRSSDPVMAAVSRSSCCAEPSRGTSSPDFELARRFIHEERFDEALRILNSLPTGHERSLDAQLLTAALLINAGQAKEAEELCGKMLAHDELNAEAHYLLALCREHSGQFAAAIDQDEMAIYLDPNFGMPQLHLGLLAKRIGNSQLARRAFEKAALLVAREDASRILLLGGGFGREALVQLCRRELRSTGAMP